MGTRVSAATVVALALIAGPAAVSGQGRWVATPSLGVTQEFDDNIFGTASDKVSDFITRLTPGLSLGYESAPLTLLASYSFGIEVYADNSDLDNVAERQQGNLQVTYRLDPRTTLGLSGAYSQNPSTADFLAPATPQSGVAGVSGVDAGRRLSSAFGVTASGAYQFDSRTSGDLAYSYYRTETSGTSPDSSHVVALTGGRQLTPLDRGTVTYSVRFFEGGETDNTTSHALLLGWNRQFGPNTSLALQAGPRVTEGDVNADASASLTHRFQEGSVALAYTRAQNLVVGRPGFSSVDAVTGTALWAPRRDFGLGLTASVSRISDSGGTTSDTTVYSVGATAAYQVTAWLSARLSYRFSHQDEDPAAITRHVVGLTLEFSYPVPLAQ